MSKINDLLKKTGLSDIYHEDEFVKKQIILRDNRKAILWVNSNDNHGILDDDFWEDDDFYSEEYRNQFSAKLDTYTSSEEHLKIYKDVNKRQFKQFKQLINDDTKFLEIGCSFGGILNHINKKKIKKCDAIEPNIQDFKFSRNKYKNCNIINSLFQSNDFGLEKYNLIVSFEVLEHVFNLNEFLYKLSHILEKGGSVNFEVPNHNDALLVDYKVKRYQSFYYHKSHVHYFTPKSLIKIFSHFGIEGDVSSFQLYPFFNQIYWLYNDCPQLTAVDALSYPIDNKSGNKVNKKVYKFFESTDKKYQKLMNDNLCGDCLIFKGTKKK